MKANSEVEDSYRQECALGGADAPDVVQGHVLAYLSPRRMAMFLEAITCTIWTTITSEWTSPNPGL